MSAYLGKEKASPDSYDIMGILVGLFLFVPAQSGPFGKGIPLGFAF